MDKKIEIAKRLVDKDFRTLGDDALWLAELVMRDHEQELNGKKAVADQTMFDRSIDERLGLNGERKWNFRPRPFTKVDWYGFAAATPFKALDETEQEPIIGVFEPNVLIIADATGLNVDYMEENGEIQNTFHFEPKPDQEWNQAGAIQLANQLAPFDIYIIRLLAKSYL